MFKCLKGLFLVELNMKTVASPAAVELKLSHIVDIEQHLIYVFAKCF